MSDTQKYTKPNVPNLRFPEFEGQWEESTFGDCSTGFDYGMNAASKPFDGEHKYIRITDIDENTSEYKEDGVVSPDSEIDEHYRVNENDILFARTGASTGKTYLYSQKDGRLYFAGFLIRMNVSSLNNARFVFYLTQTSRYKKWVQIMSMRSGQPGINSQEYSSYRCFLPKLEEQQKIADLLTLVDRRISVQNKVIEKLKSLMRGLNNKLMDNPLWNKVYLGDFMQFYSTNSLSWEQLSYKNGRMKNLHYGLIHSGLPTMTDCEDNTLPYIQAPFIPKQFIICKDGDIAFADASEDTEEVGKAIELCNTGSMDVVCGLHTIHGRDIIGMTVIGFKGFAFNSKYFHDQLRRMAQGSKVYSITAENIKNCYIYVPEVTEQRRIVGLLLCLQDKIKCAERELNTYEMQKQFMLREMLV